MSLSRYTFGVPCKIGYGYNSTLRYFYKFEDANPQNVMSTAFKRVDIRDVIDLSCTRLIRYKLGLLLKDEFLKSLDFNIINDDRDYYRLGVIISTKQETCSSCEKLPENTEYYVNEVEYGTYLDIIVPKNGFPDKRDEMKKLLESAVEDVHKLSNVQKKAKCRVRINSVEEREMTLENVFKFENEFLEGQHPGHEIVVFVEIEKNKHTAVQVKNDVNFQSFLMRVYTVYRKIEIKLEKTGHPGIVPIPERATRLSQVFANLAKAKEEYLTLDLKIDDVLKIYAVLKTLFWNYRYYLEFLIENRLDIDEGDDLPPGWEEGGDMTAVATRFKPLLKKLNNWIPVKVRNQWYYSEGHLLIVADNSEEVETKIKQLIPEIVVKKDNQLTEPHLFIYPEINGFFGFVDMSSTSPNNVEVENMEYLSLKCPESCSEQKLQWICQECGDVVRTSDFKIVCSCGSKFIGAQMFACHDVRHKIRSMKTDKLKTIALQLRKHQDRYDASTNNVFKNAVKKIVKIDQETDEINVLMTEMKNLNVFDGDTAHLIDKYLNPI